MKLWRFVNTGRGVATAFAVWGALLIASNIAASIFWASTGGAGLLDLDGGENLFQPAPGITASAASAAGSPERVLALLSAYSDEAREAHILFTTTLDLLFPLVLALAAVLGARWIFRGARPPLRWIAWIPIVLAGAGLVSDWSENVVELVLLTNTGSRHALATVLPPLSATKLGVDSVLLAALALGFLVRAVLALRRERAARRSGPADFPGSSRNR